jgi:hypothetical protein
MAPLLLLREVLNEWSGGEVRRDAWPVRRCRRREREQTKERRANNNQDSADQD